MVNGVTCYEDTCKHNKNGLCAAKCIVIDVHSIAVRNETFSKCTTYEDSRCEDATG